MEIILKGNPQEGCQLAAKIVAEAIRQKPNTVLGLPTGSTSLKMYNYLIQFHKNDGLDFSKVITFNVSRLNVEKA